jgi:hypothetical protein
MISCHWNPWSTPRINAAGGGGSFVVTDVTLPDVPRDVSGRLERLTRKEMIGWLISRGLPRGEARALIVWAHLNGVAPSSRWELVVVNPEADLFTVQDEYYG